ncbi:MAG: hypothetical protein ACYCTL_09895 [Acidimicrobiales bacterium]
MAVPFLSACGFSMEPPWQSMAAVSGGNPTAWSTTRAQQHVAIRIADRDVHSRPATAA